MLLEILTLCNHRGGFLLIGSGIPYERESKITWRGEKSGLVLVHVSLWNLWRRGLFPALRYKTEKVVRTVTPGIHIRQEFFPLHLCRYWDHPSNVEIVITLKNVHTYKPDCGISVTYQIRSWYLSCLWNVAERRWSANFTVPWSLRVITMRWSQPHSAVVMFPS